MRLFHFIEQHHAVGALAYRFSQHATLAITNVTGWRAFELAYGMGLLIFRQVQRNQRFLTAEQAIG
ncbi:hypothetical protein D3C79_748700 [compost metagenome]